ncbi:MAG TPA: GNAT family N-acetyltransferase, partial [Thermodesulfobacteriota bacterium]|nr:GNAT family N-acetyltransferase [Thermodesulfobacteriota bacterium]
MEIQEVPNTKAPIELLLEADPSIEKIKAYLPRSKCFVAMLQGEPVGAYVIQCIAPGVYELMSIAVSPEHQRKGIGSELLKHAVT